MTHCDEPFSEQVLGSVQVEKKTSPSSRAKTRVLFAVGRQVQARQCADLKVRHLLFLGHTAQWGVFYVSLYGIEQVLGNNRKREDVGGNELLEMGRYLISVGVSKL